MRCLISEINKLKKSFASSKCFSLFLIELIFVLAVFGLFWSWSSIIINQSQAVDSVYRTVDMNDLTQIPKFIDAFQIFLATALITTLILIIALLFGWSYERSLIWEQFIHK